MCNWILGVVGPTPRLLFSSCPPALDPTSTFITVASGRVQFQTQGTPISGATLPRPPPRHLPGGSGGGKMSGVWKLNPREEPTQKPEPSVCPLPHVWLERYEAAETANFRSSMASWWGRRGSHSSCSPSGEPIGGRGQAALPLGISTCLPAPRCSGWTEAPHSLLPAWVPREDANARRRHQAAPHRQVESWPGPDRLMQTDPPGAKAPAAPSPQDKGLPRASWE